MSIIRPNYRTAKSTSRGRLLPATETNRVVNPQGSVRQRAREFWAEILGCGSNPQGCFRTPVCLSRNRERRGGLRIGVNARRKGKKRETPRDGTLGVVR